MLVWIRGLSGLASNLKEAPTGSKKEFFGYPVFSNAVGFWFGKSGRHRPDSVRMSCEVSL